MKIAFYPFFCTTKLKKEKKNAEFGTGCLYSLNYALCMHTSLTKDMSTYSAY